MTRFRIFLTLIGAYLLYSGFVFTKGTETAMKPAPHPTELAMAGKRIFQDYNCAACHQVYGLGGYLGPDLTTAWSDPKRGPRYVEALIRSGGSRMPNFQFTDSQVKELVAYLAFIDATAAHETR
ncbi:cytochrome c [Flaviaesturariibacter amylovorans]|uniref:Cytochrome c domain-containing protein n=1 Tax=Flaviaesturariibacter amylovorans TaxID=1084520 RepID=A0ABP8H5R1_9BACT